MLELVVKSIDILFSQIRENKIFMSNIPTDLPTSPVSNPLPNAPAGFSKITEPPTPEKKKKRFVGAKNRPQGKEGDLVKIVIPKRQKQQTLPTEILTHPVYLRIKGLLPQNYNLEIEKSMLMIIKHKVSNAVPFQRSFANLLGKTPSPSNARRSNPLRHPPLNPLRNSM